MKSWRALLLVFFIIVALAVVIVSLLSASADRPVVINQTAVPPLPTLAPERVAQGEVLYTQYCAKCHGANLQGSPDWKKSLPDGSLPPPPHDSSGHTWHHSDEVLLGIIADGGDPVYNSKMPAFKEKLDEDEMIAVLEFIKSKWGREEREYQWWMTARPDPE